MSKQKETIPHNYHIALCDGNYGMYCIEGPGVSEISLATCLADHPLLILLEMNLNPALPLI